MRAVAKIVAALLFVALLLAGWRVTRGSGHWVAGFSAEANQNSPKLLSPQSAS
jgi:hypothetical protein